MNYKILKSLLIAISIFCASHITSLQAQDSTFSFYVTPQFGIWMADDNAGLSSGFETGIIKDDIIYSIGYLSATELFPGYFSTPDEYTHAIPLMIGKRFKKNKLEASGQGGLSPMWGLRRTTLLVASFLGGTYDSESFFTVGITMKSGVKYKFTEKFGIGIDINLIVTPKASLFTPMVSLTFGGK